MKTYKIPMFILLFLAVGVLLGCGGKNADKESSGILEQDTDTISAEEYRPVHEKVSYFDFDKIENLTSFFDSIGQKHGILVDYDDGDVYIKKCIAQIDKYRKGISKYYPDTLVSKSLSFLGFDAANFYNHNSFCDLVFAEWFIMCAAYYSPDITCLVDMQTPDHNVGVLNFGDEYNGNPWWTYVFIKRQKGFEVECLGDDVKISSLFQLEDKQNRKYYLCSQNSYYYGFRHELYWAKNEKNIVKVASCTELPPRERIDFDTYYFDKDKLIWLYCKYDDDDFDKLIPVSDSPAMKLSLDGYDSSFVF